MTPFKKVLLYSFLLLIPSGLLKAQPPSIQLSNAIKTLEADPQLKHAIIGLSVVETSTGKPVYEHNEQTGLAAASCQKVLTSAAAFELLGKEYRYKTELGYDGTIKDSILNGNLFIIGSGDPTLGSWRYGSTADSAIRKRWIAAIRKLGIKRVIGFVKGDDDKFSHQLIPGGWIWDDVGNYYGAGAGALNWKENQYDLVLRSGKNPGDEVKIISDLSAQLAGQYINEIVSGPAGSGDRAYIYFPTLHDFSLLSGTIPVNQNNFTISGAIPDPTKKIEQELYMTLVNHQVVSFVETGQSGTTIYFPRRESKASVIFDTYQSPPLDSINYWFLKRSINLYGEALVKTIALEKTGKGSTQTGVELVRDFWNRQGIDKSAINMLDGSGLSPQNRITADALVKAMQYASEKSWFSSFYNALPEINGLKMKSGSIGGARSFTGYSNSKGGQQYTFAIIVNNYDGSAGEMVRKMYKVLDILK